jgi:hypothetical protein
MEVRKTVRGASESGVSSNQVGIDIGRRDRAATTSTLNKARRRRPLQGDR